MYLSCTRVSPLFQGLDPVRCFPCGRCRNFAGENPVSHVRSDDGFHDLLMICQTGGRRGYLETNIATFHAMLGSKMSVSRVDIRLPKKCPDALLARWQPTQQEL